MPDAGEGDAALVGDRRVPYTPPNDVGFIDFFVPHHQMAIEMANMVIDRGRPGNVRDLARQIRDTQAEEITKMKSARQMLTGSAESPPVPPDAHAEGDMARMMSVSGAELERLFLLEMIPHHAAGLPPAHRARPFLVRSDMQQLRQDIFDAQSREIGEMEMMLEEVRGTDGGMLAEPDAGRD